MKYTLTYYNYYLSLSKNPIKFSLYSVIIREFMKSLVAELFDLGEVDLPERLGFLQIIGFKIKVKTENNKIMNLPPDWKSTKELWAEDEQARLDKKLVYHFNEETNGIRYKVRWKRSRVLLANKFLYDFVMCRTNKRALSKLIQNKKEYLIKE